MSNWFQNLANPTRFMALSDKLLPTFALLGSALLAVGLYQSFFVAPADYQQGETVRIMFIHVPAAWIAMFCYALMTASAIGTLVWRHPMADVSARAAAPIGAVFTALALITGSLWGKPMWGTWWVWDARLTSVLVLLIIYLGLIALWRAFDDPARSARPAAIVILVGSINLPIIKFSVDWWNTLHQPASVFRMDGPTIHPDLLWPLMIMALAITFIFLSLHLLAMRNEVLARRVRRLEQRAAARGPTSRSQNDTRVHA
ncbi:MAG: heme ABC transporter permease [Pseudomonadota bacterium]